MAPCIPGEFAGSNVKGAQASEKEAWLHGEIVPERERVLELGCGMK